MEHTPADQIPRAADRTTNQTKDDGDDDDDNDDDDEGGGDTNYNHCLIFTAHLTIVYHTDMEPRLPSQPLWGATYSLLNHKGTSLPQNLGPLLPHTTQHKQGQLNSVPSLLPSSNIPVTLISIGLVFN